MEELLKQILNEISGLKVDVAKIHARLDDMS